jgi:hypothetical protein
MRRSASGGRLRRETIEFQVGAWDPVEPEAAAGLGMPSQHRLLKIDPKSV